MNWCCQDCCGQWQCRDPWGQLRKLGSESSSISLEELWRRVTVWNYLQHQEIQNRMRRERQAVASCWTINSFAFPKPKVGEAERERSIWLEAVGRVDGTEGLSLIYQTLTEKCKWRVSPALKKANSFLRIHVLHWYFPQTNKSFVLNQFYTKCEKWENFSPVHRVGRCERTINLLFSCLHRFGFAYYEFRFSIVSSLFLENDIKVSDDTCEWRWIFLELLVFLCPSSESEEGNSE